MTKVTYRQFGAVGDGKTDDMSAIVAAHAYANEHGLPVSATAGDTYYIGGKNQTAIITTNTDWTGARFILDDLELENINQSIFLVPQEYEAEELSLSKLAHGQKHIDMTFPSTVMISVKDDTRRNYIRMGVNASNGVPVSDTFLCNADGEVLNDIMWEFPQITSASVRRIEETPLVIEGGHFTTIANQMPSKYTYHARNIVVKRSHTTVRGITHRVEGEGEHGAPYGGFLSANGCAYVTFENCSLSGHKIYYTPGNGGMSPMGTYDVGLHACAFVTLRGITQVPDIMDSTRWGLMGSNYCKNITLENCEMSRFDAHMGVTHAIVRGCKLGWQCVHAIGEGDFLVADSERCGRSLLSLRYDYGGHWDGTLTLRNVTWYPKSEHPSVISGANPGTHDFGYPCKMPTFIKIEGLRIVDTDPRIQDIALLSEYADEPTFDKPYPYQVPEEVVYSDVRCDSGRDVLPYRDKAFYPQTKITEA